MNKHLRSLHGIVTEPPNKKKASSVQTTTTLLTDVATASKDQQPNPVMTRRPLSSSEKFEWTPSSDADLLGDEDVAEVLPRLRRREPFWATTSEDHRLVKMIRDRHPRSGHLNRINKDKKGRGNDHVHEHDSDDSFDEGIGARYPIRPQLERLIQDPEKIGREAELMNRPKSQVRLIMAKAKLMLVEEENSMRRRELRDLMEMERMMALGEV